MDGMKQVGYTMAAIGGFGLLLYAAGSGAFGDNIKSVAIKITEGYGV